MKPNFSLLLFCGVILCSQPGVAAFEPFACGSRSSAMGQSLVALRGNGWSAFENPAVLQTVVTRTLSVHYVPQPFELKELARVAASYVEPTAWGSLALSASQFGFELYKETRVVLSYGDDILPSISAGVNLNYYSLSIRNYGSASTFGVDVGLLVDVSERVQWGFATFNLNAPAIGAAKEKLPQVFSTGVAFHPIDDATLTAGIVKDVRYTGELRFGVEYVLLEMVAVRAGTTNEPNTLNAGIGIGYAFIQLDYAFSSHNELGVTHQFSLSLSLGDL